MTRSPSLIPGHAGAELLDHADRLVTDDEPFLDRILALQDVDVGSADRRQRDLDERLPDARNRARNLAQLDLSLPLKHGRSHRRRHGLFSFKCVVIL